MTFFYVGGQGSDFIEFKDIDDSVISTGAGNDVLEIYAPDFNTVSLGSGDDEIYVDLHGAKEGQTVITGDSGKDTAYIRLDQTQSIEMERIDGYDRGISVYNGDHLVVITDVENVMFLLEDSGQQHIISAFDSPEELTEYLNRKAAVQLLEDVIYSKEEEFRNYVDNSPDGSTKDFFAHEAEDFRAEHGENDKNANISLDVKGPSVELNYGETFTDTAYQVQMGVKITLVDETLDVQSGELVPENDYYQVSLGASLQYKVTAEADLRAGVHYGDGKYGYELGVGGRLEITNKASARAEHTILGAEMGVTGSASDTLLADAHLRAGMSASSDAYHSNAYIGGYYLDGGMVVVGGDFDLGAVDGKVDAAFSAGNTAGVLVGGHLGVDWKNEKIDFGFTATLALEVGFQLTVDLDIDYGEIIDTSEDIYNDVSDFSEDVWNAIENGAEDVWDDVEDFAEDVWDDVEDFAEDVWDDVEDFAEDVWDDIGGGVEDAWNEFTDLF